MLDPTDGIAVYTDGSSYYKDRSGGWSWVALDAYGAQESMAGYVPDTTNNQMELYAPAHCLNWIFDQHGSCEVLIHSDSQYVILGITDRSRKRKANVNWWASLDEAVDQHQYVEWQHVRGHSGNFYNELADRLASEARKEGRNGD